jgi:hypothetical protein
LQEQSNKMVETSQDILCMDVQADEDDGMASMGYIFEQRPHLQGCELAVSPRVSAELASESIKMLFMFNQLRQLQLRWGSCGCKYTCACCLTRQCTWLDREMHLRCKHDHS